MVSVSWTSRLYRPNVTRPIGRSNKLLNVAIAANPQPRRNEQRCSCIGG